jgi:hypothetical protein
MGGSAGGRWRRAGGGEAEEAAAAPLRLCPGRHGCMGLELWRQLAAHRQSTPSHPRTEWSKSLSGTSSDSSDSEYAMSCASSAKNSWFQNSASPSPSSSIAACMRLPREARSGSLMPVAMAATCAAVPAASSWQRMRVGSERGGGGGRAQQRVRLPVGTLISRARCSRRESCPISSAAGKSAVEQQHFGRTPSERARDQRMAMISVHVHAAITPHAMCRHLRLQVLGHPSAAPASR